MNDSIDSPLPQCPTRPGRFIEDVPTVTVHTELSLLGTGLARGTGPRLTSPKLVPDS